MNDGQRRLGNPRTNAERLARHRKLYGKYAKLPKRGTGLKKKGSLAKVLEAKG